ncbi:ABC transporter ATP-binding protein [Methanosphaera sp.]|jgi:ABC-type multidrug transport system fused ATPase/permease subunit|uniref:ABC transporter ATP-binding protein n=1 Tax=Methanosphaera sp. TaxID=2666342 RepID=UPI003D8D9E61
MKEVIKPLKKSILPMIVMMLLILVEVYCDLTLPTYTASIVNNGIQKTNINLIYHTGTLMMIMVTISVLATLVIAYLSSKITSSYARRLRETVFKKVLRFSNHEFNEYSKASLITRSTNDISQIQNVMGIMFRNIIYAPILGIGSIIKAFELGTDLSWIILVVFIAVAALLVIVISHVLPLFQKIQETMDRINSVTREVLLGIPVIKAFVRQDYEIKRFEKINSEYKTNNLSVYRVMLLLLPLMTLIMNFMIVLILYFGSYTALNGTLLTGDIIAFIQYATQIVTAFIILGGIILNLPRMLISGRRVDNVLNSKLTITDGTIDKLPSNAEIEFKNVSFKYPGSEKNTLENINFKLEQGKTTAIIGGTGSGKTTILQLIPRLQDVTSGEILVNNTNIKEYKLETLREKISLAPQKALLFTGTVKTNLIKGNNNATMDDMNHALDIAQADFVGSLDDPVSQNGSNYSGGQKQRLSIARAIIGKHDFYLFDDCFSALDMQTESRLKKQLHKLKNESSILLVSQRISTIIDADEIIVLDNGKIIDRGTHEQLRRSCKVYEEIVQSQLDTLEAAL